MREIYRFVQVDEIMLRRVFVGICVLFSVGFLSACGGGSGEVSSGGEGSSQEPATPADTQPTGDVQLTRVYLDGFKDFNCSSGWTNRHGGVGRAPYSGSGSCSAEFPGESGIYSVALKAQLEFDGASPYRVSLNGNTIKQGEYPYSQGELICDCPDHEENCPDKIIDINAGTHQINTGDIIEFWGSDVYPCGNDTHGAYAIWRGISFNP